MRLRKAGRLGKAAPYPLGGAEPIEASRQGPIGILQVCEDISEGVAAGQQALVGRLCRHFSMPALPAAVVGPLVHSNAIARWLAPYARRSRHPLSPGGVRALLNAVRASRLVHIHGIWSFTGTIAALAASRYRVPYIVSPHGMLQPWLLRRKRWRKVLHLQIVGLRVLRGAAAVHCVTNREARWIRRLGGPGIATYIAPNPVPVDWPTASPEDVLRMERDRVVLFVGRLHPVKGLLPLLQAWLQLRRSYPDWRLMLVGFDEWGMWEQVSHVLRSAGAAGSVEFVGSKPRAELLELYDKASIFVLPSFTEVIGLANLEAAARGLPVVTTHRTGLDALVDYQAGLVVHPSADSIARALAALIDMPESQRDRKSVV